MLHRHARYGWREQSKWWKARVANLYSTLNLTGSHWSSDKRGVTWFLKKISGKQILQRYFGFSEGKESLQILNQHEQNGSSQGGSRWGMRQVGQWHLVWEMTWQKQFFSAQSQQFCKRRWYAIRNASLWQLWREGGRKLYYIRIAVMARIPVGQLALNVIDKHSKSSENIKINKIVMIKTSSNIAIIMKWIKNYSWHRICYLPVTVIKRSPSKTQKGEGERERESERERERERERVSERASWELCWDVRHLPLLTICPC